MLRALLFPKSDEGPFWMLDWTAVQPFQLLLSLRCVMQYVSDHDEQTTPSPSEFRVGSFKQHRRRYVRLHCFGNKVALAHLFILPSLSSEKRRVGVGPETALKMAKNKKSEEPAEKSKHSEQEKEQAPNQKPTMKNKTRVLMLSTRGVTTRFRHLMSDIERLLPHAKKESKLDSKDRLEVASEIAELRNCDTIMLFESRKKQDLYLWLSKSPFGPSVKFHIANLHTMDELSFPGNNLMHSRPILTFDPAFDETPVMRLIKELLMQTFSAPSGHRRTKPFIDHVMSFAVVDGRIWFRHYQVVDAALNEKVVDKSVESTLVEIGPRFVMAPIKCFSGGFKGATLWENDSYISPNEVRRVIRKRAGDKTIGRMEQRAKRSRHEDQHKIVHDEIHKVFR